MVERVGGAGKLVGGDTEGFEDGRFKTEISEVGGELVA